MRHVSSFGSKLSVGHESITYTSNIRRCRLQTGVQTGIGLMRPLQSHCGRFAGYVEPQADSKQCRGGLLCADHIFG